MRYTCTLCSGRINSLLGFRRLNRGLGDFYAFGRFLVFSFLGLQSQACGSKSCSGAPGRAPKSHRCDLPQSLPTLLVASRLGHERMTRCWSSLQHFKLADPKLAERSQLFQAWPWLICEKISWRRCPKKAWYKQPPLPTLTSHDP